MQKSDRLLMALLRNEVCGEDVEIDAISEAELGELYTFATSHDLAHLVASALSKRGLLLDDEISKKLEKQQMMAIFRSEGLVYELERICAALEEVGIDHIPLKGAVLREYYPESWMRTSCDIDILVRESDLERAGEVFERTLGYNKGVKNEHDVSYHSGAGVHIELHYNLIEDGRLKNIDDILATAWDHTSKKDGYEHWLLLDDAMFYLYHIAHIAKHFGAGGIGIRPFLDLWVLENRVECDRAKRAELIRRAELEKFTSIAVRLMNVWFSHGEHTDASRQLEEYILANGSYGTLENRVSATQSQNDGTKLSKLMKRIFVPYDILKLRYPIIEKYRWLSPVMQIRRIFAIAFGGRFKYSMKVIKTNVTMSDEKVKEYKKFTDEMGL